MESKIIRLASWVLSSFFLLILVLRLFGFIGIDLHLMQIMSVTFFLGGMCCVRKIGIHGFDILILFYLLYMLVNGVLIDYNYHGEFLYRAMLSHYFPVMCYFIGRYLKNDVNVYLEKMQWPLLFAMLCGIAFYFIQPSWYVMMKEAQIKEYANEMSISGVYRLSSFWGHPYILAYATFLYCICITNKLLRGMEEKRDLYISMANVVICIFVLLLAQLRVTIIVYVLCVVYMILFGKKEPFAKKIRKVATIVIFASFVAILFLHFASDSLNYITEHMLNLTEDNSMSDRFEHTAGGMSTYSFWGDGLGRYGYPAREHGMWAIVDHEFQCHVAELGYFGVSILCAIILLTMFKMIRHPHIVVENSILIFFFIAMLGASVLSNAHQYNYIFWYTLGTFWSCSCCKKRI